MRTLLGDAALLHIRPARVTQHTGTKWPVGKARLRSLQRVFPKPVVNALRPVVKKREPFVVPAAHFGISTPVTSTERYLKVADYVAHEEAFEESRWFQELVTDLETSGVAQHKSIAMYSREDIREFFTAYVAPLVQSLRWEGYRSDAAGGFESKAVIDAQGRLSKAGSGNHRFAISQVLNLPSFPLRIVAVHAEWFDREVARHGEDLAALVSALNRVRDQHV